MAPKRITVGDRKVRLEEQVDLLKFLDDEKRKSLIDNEGYEILNFKSLEDRGTYTFGPPHQQQRQRTPPSSPSSGKIPSTVVDLLERFKGKPLTAPEIDYALNEFRHYVDEIVNASTERKREQIASSLWIRLSLRIRTRTRLLLKDQYLFDGPVPGATTGLGTEIQFALKGSSLLCAKIMQNVDALQREYDTAVKIHADQVCPTVMPAIDFIQIPVNYTE